MRIETALAKGSLDHVSRRDPEKVYHKMTVAELEELAPDFRWSAILRGQRRARVSAASTWPGRISSRP